MLILSRKIGESIAIDDNIKVTVLSVYGRQVRLGIYAPLDVIVHREEIYIKIQEKEKTKSQKSSGFGRKLKRLNRNGRINF